MAELRPIDPNEVFNEIPSLKAQVRGLSATAKGIAKTAGTAGAPIPIPDINEEAKKILEIEKSVTDDEVKKAYRTMAKKYHPDRVNNEDEAIKKGAEEKFKEVQIAYETIQKERGIN